ncbi:hypothetical protein SELMODRAFT_448719 [Selaginella moellendorffii]|uniref:Protein kinase domain-containing protein n=1 Tax=Selaginella moellendorffii TaxID=88036 RepID=D8T9M9_SELML|nr:uncharacterized protein LOC9661099 [Selaginella moellendorffii]EFJ06635.1 hypothetical protein SELMODRAFT_448719 [Selaginella moellendorffii]|eukprot:XP_002992301.1 uncharacterized protein LOC9661099 [Selaginella moellendorffii]
MATITCKGKALEFGSGCTLGAILQVLGRKFGECSESPPCVYSSSGKIFLAPDELLPDGDYTYIGNTSLSNPCCSPSSQGYNVVMARQMVPDPQVLSFMPATAVPPLPLQLMHKVFGRFISDLRGELPDPTMADYMHFNDLVTACSTFYDHESDLRTELRQIWRGYLEVNVVDEMYTGSCNKHTTDLWTWDPLHDALVLLKEVKRGTSTSHTEPLMQAVTNYELNWNAARRGVKALMSDTCLPALIVQHIGQLLLVGGVITLPAGDGGEKKDKICYQPLASAYLAPLHGHDVSLAMDGVRTCMAIKAAVARLITFYGNWGDRNCKKGPSSKRRELFRRRIPGLLHREAVKPGVRVDLACEHKRVYILKKPGEDCVIKYCQQDYGADVHRAWGEAGLAPKLLSLKQVGGGWLEVRMEWLPEEDGWKLLYGLPEADNLRDEVVSNLAKAHKVEVRKWKGGTTYGVHGDMRDSNVMVKMTNGQLEVRFIDFDWAKEEGLPGSLYPSFINHEGVNWSLGVGEGLRMLQEHDKYLLGLPQAKQIKVEEKEDDDEDDDEDEDDDDDDDDDYMEPNRKKLRL